MSFHKYDIFTSSFEFRKLFINFSYSYRLDFGYNIKNKKYLF